MSRGLGKVELVILEELRSGARLSINTLAIAVIGGKGEILSLPTSYSAWQSTARAVRSLTGKGLIAGTKEGSVVVFKSLNT